MIRVIAIIFVYVASMASILGLYFTLFPISSTRPEWHTLALSVLGIIYCGLSVWEIIAYFDTRPRRYSLAKPEKIKAFMRHWISNGGRAVIFTRDMSWADEPAVIQMLHEKAKRNELTLCIQHSIALAEELQKSGATVIQYADLEHTPRSRFTIVDFERDAGRVAVGGEVRGKHEIRVFRSGHHPYFGVAEDLVKILIAYKRKANAPSAT